MAHQIGDLVVSYNEWHPTPIVYGVITEIFRSGALRFAVRWDNNQYNHYTSRGITIFKRDLQRLINESKNR